MFAMSVLIQILEVSPADFVNSSSFAFVEISVHSVIRQTCPEVAELSCAPFILRFLAFKTVFCFPPALSSTILCYYCH